MSSEVADKRSLISFRRASGCCPVNPVGAGMIGRCHDAEQWQHMRSLRNRLVHEYFDRPTDLAPALQRACEFTSRRHADFQSIHHYATTHLHISLNCDDRT